MSFKIYKENFIDITTITIDANTKIRFIRDNNNKILPNDRYLFVENILITELKLPQITVNMTNAILTINNKSGDGNVITIYSYNGDKIDSENGVTTQLDYPFSVTLISSLTEKTWYIL